MRKLFLFACLLIFFPVTVNAVFDPPHNEASGVTCDDCHGNTLNIAGGSPFWTDNKTDTAYNAVCLRCHVTEPSAGASGYSGQSAPIVKSHAPGGTLIKCTECHHNHEQEQIYPGKFDQGNFFIATGTAATTDPYDTINKTTTINYSSLAGKGNWADLFSLASKTGASRGAMLVPDTSATSSRWPVYMIESIDPDPDGDSLTDDGIITVKGEVTSAKNIGIFYGQSIRNVIMVDNQIKYLKFYDQTGANAFAHNDTPGGDDSTPNDICQVCHTETSHWRNDGTLSAVGIHTNYNGTECMDCHQHIKGFEASCDVCHGYPPAALNDLVQPPDATGSTTWGRHFMHARPGYCAEGYGCDGCHNDSPGVSQKHTNGNITIGFKPPLPIPEGGTYDGHDASTYDVTVTSPPTEVTHNQGGSRTCTNIYCHSNVQPDGGIGSPDVYATPEWDDTVRLGCNDCHESGIHGQGGSYIASGSHTKHMNYRLGTGSDTIRCTACHKFRTSNNFYGCSNCHPSRNTTKPGGSCESTMFDELLTKHANGEVNIFFDQTFGAAAAYDGTPVPGDGYGSCDTNYCHSNAQPDGGTGSPDSYGTPTWGDEDSAPCGSCHKDGLHTDADPDIDSGSHTAHLAYDFTASEAGAAVDLCLSCHPTMTKQPIKCSICHKMQTANNTFDCKNCHSQPDDNDTAIWNAHADLNVTVQFDEKFADGATYSGTPAPGDGYGTCENNYCHSDGKSLVDATMYDRANYPPDYPPYANAPDWGNAAYDPQGDGFSCNNCHDYPPRYDSHEEHEISNVNCEHCHFEIVEDSDNDGTFDTIIDKDKHVNGAYDIISSPTFGGTHTLNYTYTPKPGGGTCSSNSCHVFIGFSDPIDWRNDEIPQTIDQPLVSWNTNASTPCDDTGEVLKTLDFTVNVNTNSCSNRDCVMPFKLVIDNWGDGSGEESVGDSSLQHTYTTEYNPICDIDDASFNVCDQTNCAVNPLYSDEGTVCDPCDSSYNPAHASCDPACNPADSLYDKYKRSCSPIVLEHKDVAYDVSWSLFDAEGIFMAGQPATTGVVVCPQSNTAPEFDWLWAVGPNNSIYDLSISVDARDLDYNKGSHDGPATIQIIWGDLTEEFQVNLSRTTTTITQDIYGNPFTHTYSRGGIWSVRVRIKDNAPENTTFTNGKSRNLSVGLSSVNCTSNCSYSPPP